MREEIDETGLLTGSAPVEGPAGAAAAIAGPRREEEAAASADAGPADGGIVVETRVTVPETTAAADGDYGEFAWPEGYAADPAALAKFVPLAKRLGLAKEAAQELAGLYAELDQARTAGQAEFVRRNNAEWLNEIRSHPEFGGQNLERTGNDVAAMMRRYGSPLLTEQIRRMNVQNWPEMFYFLARMARAVSEDVSPASSGGGAEAKSTAQLLFPGLK